MSFTDPSADPVQPTEGQGGQGEGASPWDDVLSRIPEEVRGDVEPKFREWDANYTRQQQEAAEYRKQWEPYEQVGIRNLEPNDLQDLIQFRQALVENPQGVKEWWDGYAQQHGFNQPELPQEKQPWVDPSVESLVEQRLQQALAPYESQLSQLSQWRQSQEERSMQDQLASSLEESFNGLREKHGDDFDEDQVARFVANHFDPNADPRIAVEKAFADYQEMRSQIEKQLLQGKAGAPPPNGGGGTVTESGQATNLAQAEEQARAQLRAMMGR